MEQFELSKLDKKMNAIITDYKNRIIEFANRSAVKTAVETRKLEKARNFELIRLFKNVLLNIELYDAKENVPGPPAIKPDTVKQVG